MVLAKLLFIFTFLLASAVCISAQSVQFPNELKGYEFFGNGRLKDLKLGVSKKKDIEMIFRKSCEKSCNYDENFKIRFEYLAALEDCMTTEDIRDRVMCPQSSFVGTVSGIVLEPKQDQSLRELPISIFNIFSDGVLTEKGTGVSISYASFTDKYGLKYSVNKESGGNVTLPSKYPPFVAGKLYAVSYKFADDFIRRVFTVEYAVRKKELDQ